LKAIHRRAPEFVDRDDSVEIQVGASNRFRDVEEPISGGALEAIDMVAIDAVASPTSPVASISIVAGLRLRGRLQPGAHGNGCSPGSRLIPTAQQTCPNDASLPEPATQGIWNSMMRYLIPFH